MSELTTCPSFPRRREASHHTHSTGFPPARERLTGKAHGAGVAHAASSLPTSFDLAPLALYSGRGAGGEGFTLCFDWFFDREFNV